MSLIDAHGRVIGEPPAEAFAVLRGEREPVTPRPASTVMLLRDGATGIEVHLLHRAARLAFAAGMHVFPGGAVDAADSDSGADPLRVAAVRELWEEVGVLLGEGDLAGPRTAVSVTRWDTDAVRPWGRWITPEVESRRFDTHFWIALLPAGQATADDDAGGEADASLWTTPQAGLDSLTLMPPTRVMLQSLLPFATAQEAFDAAPQRQPEPTMPRAVLLDNGDIQFVLPGQPGWPS